MEWTPQVAGHLHNDLNSHQIHTVDIWRPNNLWTNNLWASVDKQSARCDGYIESFTTTSTLGSCKKTTWTNVRGSKQVQKIFRLLRHCCPPHGKFGALADQKSSFVGLESAFAIPSASMNSFFHEFGASNVDILGSHTVWEWTKSTRPYVLYMGITCTSNGHAEQCQQPWHNLGGPNSALVSFFLDLYRLLSYWGTR